MRFRLRKLDVKKDTRALMRLFIVCSLLSMLLVMVMAGIGFRQILQRYVTYSAEDDAINVSSALLAEERDRIVAVGQDGVSRMEVRLDDMPRLDRHLRSFLAPFNIVKIKIYSADCRIIYSTDHKIIGQVNNSNKRLKRALAGSYDSKLETKEKVQDLANEVKFNVDVVETYIPILDNARKVIGSFEVYIDVTRYRQQSQKTMAMALGLLVSILLLGFGISFPFIRKGTADVREIQEVLRQQSITDPLTGIYNKRHILTVAHREFSRAERRRQKGLQDCQLGFIMLDVDRFKSINDLHGHLGGDELLRQLAVRITESLRTYDAVGRFGGEEFLVVLPGADLEQTRTVAQKIWRLVREEPFTLEGEETVLTASLGLSIRQDEDDDYTDAVKRADQALYRAKAEGRDRVVA